MIIKNMKKRLKNTFIIEIIREEQECRIINIVELNYKDRVKMDTNVNNRLYVDYLKLNDNNVEKICFAPKAEDIEKFK